MAASSLFFPVAFTKFVFIKKWTFDQVGEVIYHFNPRAWLQLSMSRILFAAKKSRRYYVGNLVLRIFWSAPCFGAD